jgi:hypothetical protein
MPGVSYTTSFGENKEPAWAFSYSTRLAWYPGALTWSIVAEIFGAEGRVHTLPEYKAGLRWEPNVHEVFAATYGEEINGSHGAHFEIGMMLFTPPFFCVRSCNK